MRRPLLRIGLPLVLGFVSPIVAQANEFAFSQKWLDVAVYDGFRGNQNIRTDPATVAGVGYVHQVQMDLGVDTGDWVAVGTYNGDAAVGCADSFNAKWSIYTDGQIQGVYFCNTEQVNAFAAGANPPFKLYYGVCQLITRWGMEMNGVTWECRASAHSASDRVSAGLETKQAGGVDRNIDVKYTNMQTSVIGNVNYDNFGGGPGSEVTDPNYDYQFVGVTAYNVFLPPLN